MSDAFCKISGYSKNELIGKSHNIVRHPDMPKSAYDNLWSTIKSGIAWSGEVKNLAKDNNCYWVKADIEPEYDKNNNLKGYVAIREDITSVSLPKNCTT